MIKVTNVFFGLLLSLTYCVGYGQGLIQCGGHIVFDNGGHLVVDGVGHYYDTLNGEIDIINDGTIWLTGNWENASSGPVFTTNDGLVSLNGATQSIKGSALTKFPAMSLLGSGDKTLEVNTLVGGGYSGGGSGQLTCGTNHLWLNGQTLTVNNFNTSAVTQTGGGIISETDNTQGYGTVEWVVRNNTDMYTVPFKTISSTPVHYRFNIQTAGVNTTDSGLVSVSTYPTVTAGTPNNRALPLNVNNTVNEFGVENAHKLIDRFWVVGTPNFSSKPVGISQYGYQDVEWNSFGGSTNDILENNLRPVRYALTSNTWLYNRNGTTNAVSNFAEGVSNDFEGIWTLTDSTICPKALFSWDGNCVQSPISFMDNSTITKGTIDSWLWRFGDGNISMIQNSVNTYQTAGLYNVVFTVIGNSGCPDSLEVPVTIDERATADFMVEDDPLVDIPTQFTSLSVNTSSWDWDFGDLNTDVVENPKHTYQAEGTFDVVLIANNISNCPDTIVKSVEVNLPSLFLVPTAFSPGTNDNLNTHFGLTTLQRVSEYKMLIFNRWGEKIFESDDILKQWDGTYLGKPVPAGSYLYMLSFRDRTRKGHYSNGTVLLVR